MTSGSFPRPVLFPAIDLLDGSVVRLATGDYERSTVYGNDAAAVARDFVDQGAEWIHIVDLDAARTGEPTNRALLGVIADAVADRCRIQTGGGVRTPTDARALADLGVARVVMGSAAVRHPELVDEVADIVDVAVGLDHRRSMVAVDGWTAMSDLSLVDALGRYPRAAAFVITDIERDGMLSGPDLEGLEIAIASTSQPVIASGGVGVLADLAALAMLSGLAGVIVGRALYEGRFAVAEAIEILDGTGS